MNVKQVLEEYSTLTLDPKLKEEYIKTFYESSERFLLSFIEKIVDNQEGPDFQSIIKKNLWRWRVDNYEKYCNEYLIQLIRSGLICREFNDCFPKRGLILDLTDFGKWLKKYGIQYNLFEPGSSIYTKIQGPGFIRFRDFIKNINNKFLRQSFTKNAYIIIFFNFILFYAIFLYSSISETFKARHPLNK